MTQLIKISSHLHFLLSIKILYCCAAELVENAARKFSIPGGYPTPQYEKQEGSFSALSTYRKSIYSMLGMTEFKTGPHK